MILRKITPVICLFIITVVASCTKDPGDNNNAFLKFSNAFVHIADQQGSTGKVIIESNIDWKLSFEAPVPDWVITDKTSGNGNGSFNVTATNTNHTSDYRFATIIATPVNNSSESPARITIVQYDSTGQVAHH